MRSKGWALACALALAAAAAAGQTDLPATSQAGQPRQGATPRLPPVPLSRAAGQMLARILRTGDHAGRPFAIVDKKQASIHVYRADGAWAGSAPALLGTARGDHIVPGVGERTQAGTLRPADLTTPAGRFHSAPGRNLQGEDVVWIDYASALAIHRVRPGRTEAGRRARLASATALDNRASAGCVVVPVAFYLGVVQPVLGQGRGMVYLLPELGPAPEGPESL